MGWPATLIRGFGTLSVCGLRREPLPAIGIIIFIIYFLPVLPNPPVPRTVLGSS